MDGFKRNEVNFKDDAKLNRLPVELMIERYEIRCG